MLSSQKEYYWNIEVMCYEGSEYTSHKCYSLLTWCLNVVNPQCIFSGTPAQRQSRTIFFNTVNYLRLHWTAFRCFCLISPLLCTVWVCTGCAWHPPDSPVSFLAPVMPWTTYTITIFIGTRTLVTAHNSLHGGARHQPQDRTNQLEWLETPVWVHMAFTGFNV